MFERILGRPLFRSRAHAVTVVVGAVIGALLGDHAFPVVEVMLGNPLDELIFGIGGAALASLGFELVTSFIRV